MTPAGFPARTRQRRTLAWLAGAALLALALAGVLGPVLLPWRALPGAFAALLGGHADSMAATLLDLRLARASSAFVTGAALALAGVMMQALVRNPLADPYVLGISTGAAVGALAALLLGAALWAVDLGAAAGALAISLLLYLLARRELGGARGQAAVGDAGALLLTGVVLASAGMALVTLMLALAPESRMRGMVFWMIGDLSGAGWRGAPWLVLLAVLALAQRRARALNVMLLHADSAAALGVQVGALRRFLFVGSAVLTASAVSTAGSIGFVGLVVPHFCRDAFGADHRLLLPASALVGGAFLVLADTLARTVLSPQQLPVGVLTSLIGVPVFLIQLHRLRRGAR